MFPRNGGQSCEVYGFRGASGEGGIGIWMYHASPGGAPCPDERRGLRFYIDECEKLVIALLRAKKAAEGMQAEDMQGENE